ncbi:hypothetical protein KP509_17G068400 [Ceratopteris richardii]|uniref:Uncharacterized protein n=1 Tax=Ceratopteris richardii TaxID=49495 RepID=A0A8T2SWL1_CERRI|nr:hypothetical protein KP509_17G068400 [Ceratopteris richardii]
MVAPTEIEFQEKPRQMMLFSEKKVDDDVDHSFVREMREAAYHVYDFAESVIHIFLILFDDVLGHDNILRIAKFWYDKYVPVLQEFSDASWRCFLECPLTLLMFHIAARAAVFFVRVANYIVSDMKDLEVPFAYAIPSIPVEMIDGFIN